MNQANTYGCYFQPHELAKIKRAAYKIKKPLAQFIVDAALLEAGRVVRIDENAAFLARQQKYERTLYGEQQ